MKYWLKWFLRIAVAAFLINFFIEAMGRKSVVLASVYLVQEPLVFCLNLLIILVTFTLVFFTGRKIFVGTMVGVIWLAAGVVNGFLLTFRTTPFTAADFRLVKYGLNMITTYMTWPQIILSAAGIVLAAFLCALLWKKAAVEKERVRYVTAVFVVLASFSLMLGITRYCLERELVAVRFGNIGQAYKDYGFPYCFSNSLFNTGISKPEEYDKEVLAEIEQEELIPENIYQLEEGGTPNIIMIQLESFFDPMLWKNSTVKEDPIPFFRYLKQRYPSGYLNVPSVGAGTANTEFECITGMNLDFFGPGEYPYKTILRKTTCESLAFNLKELGYAAHAIHNNEATFYDRNRVFSQLGFDTFTPIEYMYGIERNPAGWSKDSILADEIISTLDSTKEYDFIYTISVQGHGAYPSFEYYCEQIGEMDEFVKDLIYTLNSRKEPTVVVLYGDHLPGFAWEAEEMENNTLYQTSYVIWNNLDLPRVNQTVEAYQIGAYVLDQLGIHGGTMTRFHQNYLNNPEMVKDTYLDDMKLLEYDMLYGDKEIYGGESPYLATELQMGIMPVLVDQVVYSNGNILVFGKNFNEYSKVCIDGKAADTMYIWPELLIAKEIPPKMALESEITVWQIGKDKMPLGMAEFR